MRHDDPEMALYAALLAAGNAYMAAKLWQLWQLKKTADALKQKATELYDWWGE